jgi:hypothetical protein
LHKARPGTAALAARPIDDRQDKDANEASDDARGAARLPENNANRGVEGLRGFDAARDCEITALPAGTVAAVSRHWGVARSADENLP